MAIPLTGQVSLSQIRTELDGSSVGVTVSLQTASTGGYKTIQSSTAYAPDQVAPHSMNEFRGYTQVTVDTTAPSVPSSLNVNAGVVETQMVITWNASTDNVGVTGYILQRKTGIAGSYSTIYNGPNTTYTNSGSSGTLYYFHVLAYDAAGNNSAYSSDYPYTTGTSCLVHGTIIELLNGDKMRIEELVVNTSLISIDIKNLEDNNQVENLYKWESRILPMNQTYANVIKNHAAIAERTFILNDGLLEASENHTQLVFRNGYWIFVPFKNIILLDKLKQRDGNLIEIYSIEECTDPKTVYSLTLDHVHTFYANGILTHNVK